MADLTMLPPEILSMILKLTGPRDYLCIKLTCKNINAMLSEDLATFLLKYHGCRGHDVEEIKKQGRNPYYIPEPYDLIRPRREANIDFIHAHDRIEKDLSMRLTLPQTELCLCTSCGHIKPRRLFMDSRIKAFDHDLDMQKHYARSLQSLQKIRPCIPCSPEHATKACVLVEGRKMFICEECNQPHPFEKRVYLRESKHGSVCTGCAEDCGIEYTLRTDQPGFIVYDDKVSVEQILKDVASGRIKVNSKIKITGLSK